ncbi:hypothetical protein EP7_005020 [Isosphaeraceae bacterium EP7]
MGKIAVSQARLDANRRNAERSTGPRTAEGKARSRQNSLIHGLSGAGTVVPHAEAEAIAELAEQWNSSLRPNNAFEMNLVETVATESIRINRCRIEDRVVRTIRGLRAETCWDDDRRAAVDRIARSLPSRPGEISRKLAGTAHGCDWLIERWTSLGRTLDHHGTWTDAQCARALDLLGVEPEDRDTPTAIDPPAGEPPLFHRQELVSDQIDDLNRRKAESLDLVEQYHRDATIEGLTTLDDPTLVLLRRYETASHRRLYRALHQLNQGRQKALPPLDEMSHTYRERPKDHTFVRGPAREFEDDPKPDLNTPGGPTQNPSTDPRPPQSGPTHQTPAPPSPTDQAPTEPAPAANYFGLTARLAPQIRAAAPLATRQAPRPIQSKSRTRRTPTQAHARARALCLAR